MTTRLEVKEGLSAMERVFTRDNIPSGIAKNFMNRVKRATADPSPRLAFQCPEAWDAGEVQDSLETMAILRRHYHKDWYHTIK